MPYPKTGLAKTPNGRMADIIPFIRFTHFAHIEGRLRDVHLPNDP